MAKAKIVVGYAVNTETAPSVYRDVIIERTMYGDVLKNARQLREGDNLNDDISVSNSISIVADESLRDNYFAIRFVEWAGALWKVVDVDVESPRLVLRLGGVYNGDRADPAPDPPG